jgi:lipopolysaccharide export system protein LptC
MRTRATNLLPLVLMLFLAALTLWLQYAVLEDFGSDAKPAKHDPDAVVENFTVQRLDESGKLRYTFSAPKMVHFSDDGSGEVIYPRIVELAEDGANLVATANRATVHRQGEEAFLYGNVLLLRETTPERPELRARTEFLHMLAEKGVSRTDHTVTITEGRSVLTGVGMVVDTKKHQFMLQSQVKGVFDAPNAE